MKKYVPAIRSLILMVVLVSSLFASSVLADNGITASGERYTDNKGNDEKTISVQFLSIPAEHEGWQATMSESMPVCGVVTNGVVNCEFRREDKVKGAWLHLYKGTDQNASFYVDFYVPGMKTPKPEPEPEPEFNECEPFFGFFSLLSAISICPL